MSKGPRDRNYVTALKSPVYLYVKGVTGSWTLIDQQDHYQAIAVLNVNNPWRPRPPVLSDTPRQFYHAVTRVAAGEHEFVDPGGIVYRTTGNIAYSSVPGQISAAPHDFEDWAKLNDLAIVDALTKLKRQKFNAGVAIAEARGVARMVTDCASLVTSVRSKLRKGDFVGAYSTFRKQSKYISYPSWRRKYWEEVKHVESVRRAALIPEGWLYYHYGIKPTVNDIDGAAHELNQSGLDNPDVYNNKVMGYAKFVNDQDQELAGSPNLRRKSRSFQSVRVYLNVRLKDGIGALLSTLGATNVPEAVWNGIQFSFLVDYLTNIGDYLHVLDAGVGWDISDTWTQCWRHKIDADITYVPGSDTTYVMGGTSTYRYKAIVRTINSGLYGPMGQIRPRVKIGPSLTRMANVLSLLATGFKAPVRP